MFKNILLVVLSLVVIFAAGYGYGMMISPKHAPSDVNKDGVVNLQDISIVLYNMEQATSTLPQ